jgi:SNF2 family DNA or RNA helicase
MHFYLAGETEKRGRLVQEFQNSAGAAVFLISLKAGGFGLNLTAASYVACYSIRGGTRRSRCRRLTARIA